VSSVGSCCAFVALAALVAGCRAEAAERSEAAAVSRAVDSLRNADNVAKGPHLGNLRAAPCSLTDVCAVRSTCITGYELHIRAFEALALAMAAAGDGGASDAERILEKAKADLDRANGLVGQCTAAQGEMIRKYGLSR
jgi:hypothetical protein